MAEDTIKLLKKQGLSVSAVTITAKEKICIQKEVQCNPESCERAKGHFDRINEALYALLDSACDISRENLLLYAERYNVCPYELSFEAAVWSDCIICDYNYVFDPHVNRIFILLMRHIIFLTEPEICTARILQKVILRCRKSILKIGIVFYLKN